MPRVCITVRDTGAGMPTAVLRRVFEPFITTRETGQGTGLGLAIVHGLVREPGGTIDVQSTPGVGTVFTILLPLRGDDQASEPVVPIAEPVMTGTETSLLVEDEEGIRKVLARVLSRLGFRVHVATDGAAGLAAFEARASEIDLVITDLVMPNLGGADLLREIRSRGSVVPFIVMTGYSSDETRRQLGDSSVPVLEKPWTLTLYSMGEDGRSVPPLTASRSRDHLVRANDGGYVGIASGC